MRALIMQLKRYIFRFRLKLLLRITVNKVRIRYMTYTYSVKCIAMMVHNQLLIYRKNNDTIYCYYQQL